jgi:murein DD-endopeptidase MepM/ murein hydrolase activator NlpD
LKNLLFAGIIVSSIQKKENLPKMKNRYNSFGRHGKSAVFLSVATAMAVLTLTSCADRSELPDTPPFYEDTTVSDSVPSQTPDTGATGTETDAVSPEEAEKVITVTEKEIPFDVKYIYDENLYDDERIVLREGKNGYTVSTYRVYYENGREVSRELLSQTVTAPEAQEIVVGTKPSVSEKTETLRGETVPFGTRYEYDAALEAGKTIVRVHGADGYTESVYRITYYRGEEVSRELVSSEAYAPVEKVVVIGTKEVGFFMPFLDAAHGGYNYSVTQDFSSSHRGIDFGVWYGDPICAIKGGKVIAAYDEGYFSKDNILWTYGTYVVVEHEDGMRSYYAHLKSRTVSVGDTVSGGQIIGYSGNTGRTNPEPTAASPLAGTHLHFEIRVKKNGVYVTTDPKAYLPYWN